MPGAIVNTQANQQSQPSLNAGTGPSVNTFQYHQLSVGPATATPVPRVITTDSGFNYNGTLTAEDGHAWFLEMPGVGFGAGQGVVINLTLPANSQISYRDTLVDISATGTGPQTTTLGTGGTSTGAITCSFTGATPNVLRIRLMPNFLGSGAERETLPCQLWVRCTNVSEYYIEE